MRDYKYVEELIDRFFEGQTSNKEEQELYDFFARKDIPEHLLKFKSVFHYFGKGIEEEIREIDNISSQLPEKSKRKQLIVWVSVAASFLILISIGFSYNKNHRSFDSLEGSYIIRNGLKITDLDEIRPELEEAINNALLQQEKYEGLFSQLNEQKKYYQEIEQSVENRYDDILDQFQDEYVRNEVIKILDIN